MYNRILIKLSGEILLRDNTSGETPLDRFVNEVKELQDLSVEVAIVIGAGNVIRGLHAEEQGIDRYTADYIGMIATLINALFLKDILTKNGVKASVMSSLEVKDVCPSFSKEGALRVMGGGKILILAGGTGNPYFTTDTAAALRAIEINAEILLKATKVDGVYTSDPVTDPEAKKFNQLTYEEVIKRNLKVMDLTAISLCRENHLPIVVCNMDKPGNIKKILKGERVGTLIKG